MSEDDNPNALKHRFDVEHLKRTANAIHAFYPQFNRRHYIDLFSKFAPLEMKARVRLLRDELKSLLPASYPKALSL